MAQFLDKVKIPTAVNKRTSLDLGNIHITTSDWFKYKVSRIVPVVPTQGYFFDKIQTYAKLDPLPVPTFGRGRIHTKAFFVPFKTIFSPWHDFITDTPHQFSNGSVSPISFVPCISDRTLLNFFLTSTGTAVPGADSTLPGTWTIPAVSQYVADVDSSAPLTVEDDSSYDFVVTSVTDDDDLVCKGYKLTSFGRYCYDMLRCLGMSVNFDERLINNDAGSYQSLLPLFAAAKIYCDWYYPLQYANDDLYLSVYKWFNYDESDIRDAFTVKDMLYMLYIMRYVSYDSDYFTSAWDRPESPSLGHSSSFNITDITSRNATTSSYKRQVVYSDAVNSSIGANDAPILTGGSDSANVNSLSAVSKYSLDVLNSLSDYLKRHQLSGSLAINRYLARFGVKLEDYAANRSQKLFESSQRLRFNDVFSTSDTEGAELGSYAGRGDSFGESSFRFDGQAEYGYIIFISTIIPEVGYYQGNSRIAQHISKLDFFTPEFDSLGVQAIGARELYVPMDSRRNGSLRGVLSASYDDYVFGFTGRYAEYKVANDCLSGDFLFATRNQGKSAWNLLRNINPYLNLGLNGLRHSKQFLDGSDAEQYNRIFYNTSSDYDHFTIIHNFDVKSSFPGSGLFDTYEFDDDDKSPNVVMSSSVATEN